MMFSRQRLVMDDGRRTMDNGPWSVVCGQSVIKLFLAMVFLLIGLSVNAQAQFLYVNNETSNNSVSGFRINADGTLTPVPGSPFATGGTGGRTRSTDDFSNATIHVKGNFLFACNTASNTVSVFRINSDGSLSLVNGSPFPTGGRFPVAVITNPQGTLLFASNHDTFSLSVFHIAPTGALSPVFGSPFPLRPLREPTSLAINSAGTLLFVGGEDALGVCNINPDGSIAAVDQPIDTGLNTQALVITVNDKFIYAADADTSTISAWKVSTDGQLTELARSPYPLSLSGGTFGLAINPKGNLLFATAPSESSVYAFRIASSGALQTVNGSPFSTSASELKPVDVDSSGNFVYAVDVNNRLIHIFRITSTRGTLAEILGSPFPVGGVVGRPSGIALK